MNSKNEDIFININGELFYRRKENISIDSGFLLGDVLGKELGSRSSLVFIEEHLERLYKSAKGISLDIPFSQKRYYQ